MKFELKHRDDLTANDFIEHNIWVQYYSADEIDFIEKETYNRKEIESKLKAVNWSDEYWFKSLLTYKATPYMFTRFYAQFTLPNNSLVDGFIEVTQYSGVQNYSLYVDGEFISLNIHHPELSKDDEARLKNKLKLSQIYPMHVKCSREIQIDNIFNPHNTT